MNQPVMKITVNTEALKGILPEEAFVEIERGAVEKLAEELKRKLQPRETIVRLVSSVVQEMVAQEFRSETHRLNTAWSFPSQGKTVAKDLVEKLVEEAFDKAFASVAGQVEAKVEAKVRSKIFNEELTAARARFARAEAELEGRIERLATEKFLAVLKQAKETGLL